MQSHHHISVDSSKPLLVFGGPYSNHQATHALLTEARSSGIPPGNTLCTGDLVAYCANPNETVEAIRTHGLHVIQGNCEEQLAAGALDCGCGFDEGSTCDALSAQWYAFANNTLDASHRSWMNELPKKLVFDYAGHRCTVIHGGSEDIAQFIFASMDAAEKSNQIAAENTDIMIAGHCGLPFVEQVENGTWLNAGVIGMPANDGTPDTWYALISPSQKPDAAQELTVTVKRLHYDAEAASRAMRNAPLSEAYASALTSGLWPSLDVLPPKERAATGLPLGQAKTRISSKQKPRAA